MALLLPFARAAELLKLAITSRATLALAAHEAEARVKRADYRKFNPTTFELAVGISTSTPWNKWQWAADRWSLLERVGGGKIWQARHEEILSQSGELLLGDANYSDFERAVTTTNLAGSSDFSVCRYLRCLSFCPPTVLPAAAKTLHMRFRVRKRRAAMTILHLP